MRRGIAWQEPRTGPRGENTAPPQTDRGGTHGPRSGVSPRAGPGVPGEPPMPAPSCPLSCQPPGASPAARQATSAGHPGPRHPRDGTSRVDGVAHVTCGLRLLRTRRGMCSGTGSEGHWAGGEVRAGPGIWRADAKAELTVTLGQQLPARSQALAGRGADPGGAESAGEAHRVCASGHGQRAPGRQGLPHRAWVLGHSDTRGASKPGPREAPECVGVSGRDGD